MRRIVWVICSLLILTIFVSQPVSAKQRAKRTFRLQWRTGSHRVAGATVGDDIIIGTVAAGVQPPGQAVIGNADGIDGAQELKVETLRDGTVVVTYWTNHEGKPRGAPVPKGSVLSECSDGYYEQPIDWYRTSTHHWRFNKNSTPAEVNADNAEQALRDAHVNITHEVNNCGRPDTVSATVAYDGTTTTYANIDVVGGADHCPLPTPRASQISTIR